jgi:hypothetical protein
MATSKKKPGYARKNTAIMLHPELRGTDKAALNRLQKEQMVGKIFSWIIDDNKTNKGELVVLIKSHAPKKLGDTQCLNLINYAVARMEEIGRQEAQVVIALHVEWYEYIYKYFDEIGHAQGANKAMKAKEELLGIIKNKVTVNQKVKTTIIKEVRYNTGKLNDKEKKRLVELLNKAK